MNTNTGRQQKEAHEQGNGAEFQEGNEQLQFKSYEEEHSKAELGTCHSELHEDFSFIVCIAQKEYMKT